ncbi:hypothetical protein COCCADRAFT_8949 [Bipolaris zeicola 26-R-13]|uniref:L-ornithine N(5)-oxygenase n=1 Tax=Cochliobolus carbonum (strain 26-R-13) TaxID=930089 RepID=W6XUB2_COCC2|nr:uncharacterized protein COCCADRAFT_8949 [Bipolaris zeicola 26-R-13]EUC28730.1 hypothetical protein COCCADRAFT_8949 [Bipolaris zeicola 26-R-13]
MKFNHQVRKAVWDDVSGKWSVFLDDIRNGTTITDTAEVLISAVGILNAWKWPETPGLYDFKGVLVHSAAYPEDLDLQGKRVALIGGGSSGIQILPQIQKQAKVVHHYMKGRTWNPTAGIGGEGLAKRGGDPKTPLEDLERLKNDPAAYREYRRTVEDLLNRLVEALYKDTEGAKQLFDICKAHMKEKLSKKPGSIQSYCSRLPSWLSKDYTRARSKLRY